MLQTSFPYYLCRCRDPVEATEQRDIQAEQALADTLYGSDDNHEAAKEQGFDLIAPTLDKQKDLFCTLTDFEFFDNGFGKQCASH